MAKFDQDGKYELRYNDHANVSFKSNISANDDADALDLARSTQYPGLALQLWYADRLIERFPTKPRALGAYAGNFV